MRIGNIVIATHEDLGKLYETAIRILERVGMRVTHAVMQDALAAYGAKVSRSDGVVRMPAKVIEKATVAMRTAGRNAAAREGPFPGGFSASFGDGCFFLWDHRAQAPRRATKEDFITTVRFADAIHEIPSFEAPVEIGTFPPETMVLEMQALCYLHSPKASGVENNVPAQIKYLAALHKVAGGYRDVTGGLSSAQGITSPLGFDDRQAELYIEGGKYGFGGNAVTMAIAGANAPVTVEGCAVQATAELLGAWVCMMAVDEGRRIGSLALTGTIDMRTGKACFSTPGAIRQNSLTAAALEEFAGVPIGYHFSSYTDVVVPGYQCALDRVTRMLAQAPQGGSVGFHVGDLDGASVLSLEQAIIDLDVSRAAWELYKPARFDDEMMAVGEIERVGLEQGGTHLATDFTLEHFRDALWMPEVIPHVYWKEDLRGVSEADIVEEAHARWQRIVAEHEPYRAPKGLAEDLEKVLSAARAELL